MNFSTQLEQMVYTTPVVKLEQKEKQATRESSVKNESNKNMLNELGLAIKRR